MVVIILSNAPPALRGDLTKWLQEISTGVYVGKISARVRDELWDRVINHIKQGQATMVYNTNNEQGVDFRVHGNVWQPIDFDGLKLMLRPNLNASNKNTKQELGFSKAARTRKIKSFTKYRANIDGDERYIVLDIETTGLSATEDKIIEIGAILIDGDQIVEEYSSLVKIESKLPEFIVNLTGITDDMLKNDGRNLNEVMLEFMDFAAGFTVVSHNPNFDYSFIRNACSQLNLPMFSNKSIDTIKLAKRTISDISNYKLETLLKYFDIEYQFLHRSLEDCINLHKVYNKLINYESEQD